MLRIVLGHQVFVTADLSRDGMSWVSQWAGLNGVGYDIFAKNWRSWKLETLGQCIPPPRHVLPVLRYGSRSGPYPDQ